MSRPAAETGPHVQVLGVAHDDQPQEHHGDASRQGIGHRDNIQPGEQIHGLAHHQGIDEHGKADGLFQDNVNGQNDKAHGDGGVAVENAQGFGQTQVEHIPGARADTGMDGEIDPQPVKEQTDGGNETVKCNGTGGPVPAG